MASFQAKICRKKQRKSENKNYRSVSFLPDPSQKIRKRSKKIQKIEKDHYCFISNKNRLERAEKERK